MARPNGSRKVRGWIITPKVAEQAGVSLTKELSKEDMEKLLAARRDVKSQDAGAPKGKGKEQGVVDLKRPSKEWSVEEMVEAGVFSVSDVEFKDGAYQLKPRTSFSTATGAARNPYPELERLKDPQTISRLTEARQMLGTTPSKPQKKK